MAARRPPQSWSGRNDRGHRNLALREVPGGIFPTAALVRALPRRCVRVGSCPRGGRGGDFHHPPHARADRLAAAPHRQRAHDRRPALYGWFDRRQRARYGDRIVRRGDRALRQGEGVIYPAFFHPAAASSTRRAAFAIATSIMRPSTVVEALACLTAWSKASSTRA